MTYMHPQAERPESPAVPGGPNTEAEILALFNAVNRLNRRYAETGDDADYHAFAEAEVAALAAPCVSARVAAGQLRLGALASHERGDRTDGLEVRAMERVIAFLESADPYPVIATAAERDEVAQLALDRKRLQDLYNELEEIEVKAQPRFENPIASAMGELGRQIEAIEERAATLQPTTAAGAMFHLALANQDATTLQDFDMDEAARLALLEQMRQKLDAVMRFLEVACGRSRTDLRLDTYTPANSPPAAAN